MGKLMVIWIIVMACILNVPAMFGQSTAKKNKIIADSKTAKVEFIKTDPHLKGIFEKAYGYATFPNLGKGGFGIGGAAGNGAVY
jgi:lipid-binding SYLF domain-containing protein